MVRKRLILTLQIVPYFRKLVENTSLDYGRPSVAVKTTGVCRSPCPPSCKPDCGLLCGVLKASYQLSPAQNQAPTGLYFFSLCSSPSLAFKMNRQIYSVYILFPMVLSEIVLPISYIIALCKAFGKFISLRGISGNKVSLYFT